jgi:hypothetical protein
MKIKINFFIQICYFLKNFYLDSISDDFLVVDVCFRVDLAADHDVTCFGESLARDLCARILLEMGIEDGV